MSTVNFQCGHCQKLMAVGSEYLGQQVRCPHCQQVVVAPQPVAPTVTMPPPAPEIKVNKTEDDEPESIFGQAVDTDDLFGRAPKPSLEMPAAPNMQLEPTFIQVPGPAIGEQPRANGPYASSTNLGAMPSVTDSSATGWMPRGSETMISSDSSRAMAERAAARRRDSGSLFTSYIMIILIPYAIFITVVAIILFMQKESTRQIHPLEMIPARPDESKDGLPAKSGNQVWQQLKYDTEVPTKLRVALGQTLTVGDLEVEPIEIEQKQVVMHARNQEFADKESKESLVLHLRLKNISKEGVTFRPTDPVFDRGWDRSKGDGTQPFTYLQVGGSEKFFGFRTAKDPYRYYIAGQEDHEKILRPGEQIKTCVFTFPDGKAPSYVQSHKSQPPLWRVQLRRGFVNYNGKDYPCSFVMGVEFTADQIKRRG